MVQSTMIKVGCEHTHTHNPISSSRLFCPSHNVTGSIPVPELHGVFQAICPLQICPKCQDSTCEQSSVAPQLRAFPFKPAQPAVQLLAQELVVVFRSGSRAPTAAPPSLPGPRQQSSTKQTHPGTLCIISTANLPSRQPSPCMRKPCCMQLLACKDGLKADTQPCLPCASSPRGLVGFGTPPKAANSSRKTRTGGTLICRHLRRTTRLIDRLQLPSPTALLAVDQELFCCTSPGSFPSLRNRSAVAANRLPKHAPDGAQYTANTPQGLLLLQAAQQVTHAPTSTSATTSRTAWIYEP